MEHGVQAGLKLVNFDINSQVYKYISPLTNQESMMSHIMQLYSVGELARGLGATVSDSKEEVKEEAKDDKKTESSQPVAPAGDSGI